MSLSPVLSFLYSLFLKLFYPTSISLILLLGSAAARKRKILSRPAPNLQSRLGEMRF